MIKKLLILLLVLGVAGSAFGADYYIDADAADDTGTGAIGDPWKTIAKVESSAGASDVVYFQRGDTWADTLDVPAANMTFSAYGSGALPIITGSGVRTYGVVVGATASGTTIEYLDITGATNQGIRNFADGLTVRYCDIHGNTNYGVITYATSSNADVTGVRITENNIYENGENTAYGNVFFSAQNGYQITSPEVDNNTIYNSSDDAATGEKGIAFLNVGATTGLITGGSIHDNDISDIEGRAIELAVDVTGVSVYNNACEDTYICVHLGGAGADSNDSATSNSVYDNTSDGHGDCTGSDCVAYLFDDYAESNTIYDNLSENHSIGLKFNNDDGSNIAHSNRFLSCVDYGVIFKDAEDTDSVYHNVFVLSGGSGTGAFFSDSTESPVLTNNILLSTNTDTCGWDEGTPATAAPANTYNDTYGFGTAFCEGSVGVGGVAIDPVLDGNSATTVESLKIGGTKVSGITYEHPTSGCFFDQSPMGILEGGVCGGNSLISTPIRISEFGSDYTLSTGSALIDRMIITAYSSAKTITFIDGANEPVLRLECPAGESINWTNDNGINFSKGLIFDDSASDLADGDFIFIWGNGMN